MGKSHFTSAGLVSAGTLLTMLVGARFLPIVAMTGIAIKVYQQTMDFVIGWTAMLLSMLAFEILHSKSIRVVCDRLLDTPEHRMHRPATKIYSYRFLTLIFVGIVGLSAVLTFGTDGTRVLQVTATQNALALIVAYGALKLVHSSEND